MKHYYYCDTEEHTYQTLTEKDSPRCITCGSVMTYGKFSDKHGDEFMVTKPGVHKLIDGTKVYLDRAIVAS